MLLNPVMTTTMLMWQWFQSEIKKIQEKFGKNPNLVLRPVLAVVETIQDGIQEMIF